MQDETEYQDKLDNSLGLPKSPDSADAKLFHVDVEVQVCRVCLKTGSIPIFGGDKNLSEDLQHFGCIVVSPDDGLPQTFCSQCHDLLEVAIMFRSLAQKSDAVLRHRSEDENFSNLDSESQASQFSVGKIEDQDVEEIDKSSEEDLENSVYLEYAETVKDSEKDNTDMEDSIIEESTKSNDNVSIPENIELEPGELETLVDSLNKHARFLRCEICDVTFKTTEQINEHRLSHHPAEIATCEVCKNIIQKDLYGIHLKLHREAFNRRNQKKNKKLECTECGKLISKSYMKRHMELHITDEKRFKKCTICNKLITVNYLSHHMKRHMQHNLKYEEKSILKLKCPVCFRLFKDSTYESHVASHASNQKKYVCEECGRECCSPSSFATHILTHREEYKYKCQFCPYRGKHLGLLKVHVRTHTKDYLYKCKTCEANFLTKSNLSAHERTHATGVKFICSYCGKCFAAERTLKNHIKCVHQGIKAFPCDICGKSFGVKDVMMAHKKRVHNVVPISRIGRKPSYLIAAQKDDVVED